jgi:hypothetical protein
LAFLPVSSFFRSGLFVAQSPQGTIRQAGADGYRSKVASRAPGETRPIWRFLRRGTPNFGVTYWVGLFDAITVTGVSRY